MSCRVSEYDSVPQELSGRTKHHKPVWRISRCCCSQPLALSRVFILHTSHFTTIYSSSKYLCDSSCCVVTLHHKHVHAQAVFFPSHIPNLCVNYRAVLSLTRALIYGCGVILTQSCWAEREKDERRQHSIWIYPDLEHFQVLHVKNIF